MISDVVHLCIHMCVYIYICHLYVFLEKYLFISSAHFLFGLFAFLILSCLYILESKPLCHLLCLQLFSPIMRVVSSSCL